MMLSEKLFLFFFFKVDTGDLLWRVLPEGQNFQ